MSNEEEKNDKERKPPMINIGECFTIGANGQATINGTQVVVDATIEMKNGIYGMFIMTNQQAFFFPLTQHESPSNRMSLFGNVDATRQACLKALKNCNTSHMSGGVAQVVMVLPPKRPDQPGTLLDPQHSTSSYRQYLSNFGPESRVAQKVKQSLSTLGIESHWKEHFQSPVMPKQGSHPVLQLQQNTTDQTGDDDGDDGDDGGDSGIGTIGPKQEWSLLYKTETPEDGLITEEVSRYKHQITEQQDASQTTEADKKSGPKK